MAKRRRGPRLTPLGYIVLGILVLVIIVGVYFVIWSFSSARKAAQTPVLPGNSATLSPAGTPTLPPIAASGTPTLPPIDASTPTAPPVSASVSPASETPASATPSPKQSAVRTPTPKEADGAVDGTLGNSGVVLRAAPNKDGEILGKYDSGTKLKVYAVDGDYYYCRVEDAKLYGYMAVKFIKKDGLLPGEAATPSPKPADGTVNGKVSASKLAIRSVPSTEGNTPIGECTQGDALWIYFKTGEFYYVQVVDGGLKGYAYTSFVSADGSVPEGTPVP